MSFACSSALIATIFIGLTAGSRVDRPRGVSITKNVFYDPSKDFTCLDGSRTMPFSHVNDDYCDCEDGSDEPGTSACPSGTFHCTNAGFRPQNIPSSRVNDGICDCCDGSDEWNRDNFCQDNCKELWRAAQEDLRRQAEAAYQGVAIRKEYSEKGMNKKRENEDRLGRLKQEVEGLKKTEEELTSKKESAESTEKQAKETEQLAWDNFKAKVQQQQNSRQAADAFTELDTDKDGSISVAELQLHLELDVNAGDGVFTEEEAKAVLDGDSAEAPHFIEVTWNKISEKFVHKTEDEKQPDIPEDEEDHEEDYEDDEDDLDDDDDSDEEDYEEDLDNDLGEDDLDKNDVTPHTTPPPPPEDEPAEAREEVEINLPSEPVWSEATKILIDAADNARKEFDDNARRKTDAEREISSLEKKLAMDFGHDEAFQELHGNCYELDTNEYIYRLCPFDKAAQKPKAGGSETSLGRWGSWNGPENNKYSSMKYPNGLRCWNGPDRSTEVKISCGSENKLLSASEPSRCEYRFEFATPAACEQIDIPERPHDEL